MRRQIQIQAAKPAASRKLRISLTILSALVLALSIVRIALAMPHALGHLVPMLLVVCAAADVLLLVSCGYILWVRSREFPTSIVLMAALPNFTAQQAAHAGGTLQAMDVIWFACTLGLLCCLCGTLVEIRRSRT